MTDIVDRLREATVDIETREELFPGVFGHSPIEDLKEAANEIERLREKCNKQAMVLKQLTPEQHPSTLFIHAEIGERDQNNMPEKLLVVPSLGVDWSQVYVRTETTDGPKW